MDFVSIIGSAAAICSTVSFAPQAWKIIATRDTASISAPAYGLTVTAFALWLAYGWFRSDWPLLVSNGICFVLSGFILIMKLLPQAQKEAVSDLIDPA